MMPYSMFMGLTQFFQASDYIKKNWREMTDLTSIPTSKSELGAADYDLLWFELLSLRGELDRLK